MFTVIVQDSRINDILSEYPLSADVIKSYEKIHNGHFFKIYVYDTITKEVFKFSKEELNKEGRAVMITDEQVKGNFKEYYRILADDTKNVAGFYKHWIRRMYEEEENNKTYLDQWLCGEKI